MPYAIIICLTYHIFYSFITNADNYVTFSGAYAEVTEVQIMEEHIADAAFNVEDFGKEVAMSRMQLFRKLKALTNHSPSEFIRIMRLKRGAELLSHGAGNIAEVGFLVGFHDPSHFTKCFQKQFGQTPSEYIQQHGLGRQVTQ